MIIKTEIRNSVKNSLVSRCFPMSLSAAAVTPQTMECLVLRRREFKSTEKYKDIFALDLFSYRILKILFYYKKIVSYLEIKELFI